VRATEPSNRQPQPDGTSADRQIRQRTVVSAVERRRGHRAVRAVRPRRRQPARHLDNPVNHSPAFQEQTRCRRLLSHAFEAIDMRSLLAPIGVRRPKRRNVKSARNVSQTPFCQSTCRVKSSQRGTVSLYVPRDVVCNRRIDGHHVFNRVTGELIVVQQERVDDLLERCAPFHRHCVLVIIPSQHQPSSQSNRDRSLSIASPIRQVRRD
jgi:hypothetical protein